MAKKERKITPAEKARNEIFLSVSDKMAENGFKRTDLTIGAVKANVLSLVVMLPFALAALIIFFAVNPVDGLETSSNLKKYLLLLLGMIILAVIHEGIHGLVWGAFAEGHFKAIQFGVIWSVLTPYCACCSLLKRWQYVLGSAMPTIVVGFGLAAVSTALADPLMFALAELMIFGGGGDFIIICKTLAYKSGGGELWFYDHHYECGVAVFEKQ